MTMILHLKNGSTIEVVSGGIYGMPTISDEEIRKGMAEGRLLVKIGDLFEKPGIDTLLEFTSIDGSRFILQASEIDSFSLGTEWKWVQCVTEPISPSLKFIRSNRPVSCTITIKQHDLTAEETRESQEVSDVESLCRKVGCSFSYEDGVIKIGWQERKELED